jgi:NAD(P)-dependent dehydrogenase (short-subunit alcohol dehydrogenase family)
MTILVTGAASGIGAALLAMLGSDAIGLDRHNAALVCDLADPAAIAAVAERIEAPLDGIAHVAGVPGTADAATVLAVNCLAPAALTAALLPKLCDGAAIVAVSSIAALRCDWANAAIDALLDGGFDALPGHAASLSGPDAYEISKAALNRWVVRQSAQWQPRGIRVNGVSPGPVETPILADFKTSMGQDRIAAAAGLVGRHGTPGEVATAITFLLSSKASWINGIDLRVDGGFHAIRAVMA